MREILIYVFLIVITDPYKGINYSKPNAYYFTKEYQELEITEITPEAEAREHSGIISNFKKFFKKDEFDYLDEDFSDGLDSEDESDIN